MPDAYQLDEKAEDLIVDPVLGVVDQDLAVRRGGQCLAGGRDKRGLIVNLFVVSWLIDQS